VIDFVNRFKRPETLVAIDPVLGDNGKLYPTFSDTMCLHMKQLVKVADIVFPNITEALLLIGNDCSLADIKKDDIDDLAHEISKAGPQKIVITGAVHGNSVTNYVYDFKDNQRFEVSAGYNHKSYSGTGDVFASIVCGKLTLGQNLEEAVGTAAAFIERAVDFTENLDADTKEGIIFEPFLKELA
jgi:pyridoxine kinase